MVTVHCSLLTVYCALLTAHCSPLSAHCSLRTAPCSLLTSCHSLLTDDYPQLHTYYCLAAGSGYTPYLLLLSVCCGQRINSIPSTVYRLRGADTLHNYYCLPFAAGSG